MEPVQKNEIPADTFVLVAVARKGRRCGFNRINMPIKWNCTCNCI